ncbi:outer membrane beta-barrel protein [Veronia pacifica]|uniref:Outer membrane protein beta-barrel domain-containing protein n=2 Tax=Veronia pacifica TaxID=1080227 RepID=A0A1C3ELE0_9GAMM|nr:hypothetical protein A8L45_08370 [Veronia pacifica]
MKMFVLSTVILTSLTAHSAFASQNINDHYNFISGGAQFSTFNESLPNKASNDEDARSKNIVGVYLRASSGLTNNLFTEARVDFSKKNKLKVTDGLIGAGYVVPLDEDASVYGLMGYSIDSFEFPTQKKNHKGLTGELGVKYQATSNWTFEPAIRYADYERSMYEIRVNNTFNVSDDISVEANIIQDRIKGTDSTDTIEQTKFLLGARYNF